MADVTIKSSISGIELYVVVEVEVYFSVGKVLLDFRCFVGEDLANDETILIDLLADLRRELEEVA